MMGKLSNHPTYAEMTKKKQRKKKIMSHQNLTRIFCYANQEAQIKTMAKTALYIIWKHHIFLNLIYLFCYSSFGSFFPYPYYYLYSLYIPKYNTISSAHTHSTAHICEIKVKQETLDRKYLTFLYCFMHLLKIIYKRTHKNAERLSNSSSSSLPMILV